MVEESDTFQSLGLCQRLCENAEKLNWLIPTPIQMNCIPKGIKGEDVAGMAETGSGKTGAFLLSMFHRFIELGEPTFFCLIIAPTHELVLQIQDVAKNLINDSKIRIISIYGGQNEVEQMLNLSQEPHIIIATPGRLSYFVNEAIGFSIKSIKCIIIDEADKMTSISFFDDLKSVISHTSYNRQIMMFSATLPTNIHSLSTLSIKLKDLIIIGDKTQKPKSLEKKIVLIKEFQKEVNLIVILEEFSTKKFLIFASNIRFSIILFHFLNILKYKVGMIHGKIDQENREIVIDKFKNNLIQILISTEVASRGIDILDIDIVINFDFPKNKKDYIHRCGRVGRANQKGLAISFITR